ncbi:MAG: hypothetical protein AAFN78_06530 [Pseudomonadota bacterium]
MSNDSDQVKQQRARAARNAALLGVFAFVIFLAFIGATALRG